MNTPGPPDADPLPERAAGEPGDEPRPLPPAPVRVYRSGSATRTRRRKVAYGIVFGTAALAFLIAVVAVTVPELVAGGSIGKRDGGTTFGLGGTSKKPSADKRDQAPQDGTPEKPQTDRKEQQTTPGETETAPEATETAPETETTETAPPPITAPAPAPRQ